MADLIDRDALEPFYESGTDPNDTYADMTFIRAEHIENAPAVNRWIPCKDKLPKMHQEVIIAVYGSDMISPDYEHGETLAQAIERNSKQGYVTLGFIGSDGWYGADGFPLMICPSYWMPKPDLPEPPKE